MIGWIKIKSKSSDEHEERGSVDVGLNAHAKSSVLYRRSVAGSFFTKFSLFSWLATNFFKLRMVFSCAFRARCELRFQIG